MIRIRVEILLIYPNKKTNCNIEACLSISAPSTREHALFNAPPGRHSVLWTLRKCHLHVELGLCQPLITSHPIGMTSYSLTLAANCSNSIACARSLLRVKISETHHKEVATIICRNRTPMEDALGCVNTCFTLLQSYISKISK